MTGRTWLRRCRARVAISFVAFGSAVGGYSSVAAPLTVYVATDGSESANGLDKQNAVATIKKAVDIAKENIRSNTSSVVVNVAPGKYENQRLKMWGTPGNLPFSLIGERIGDRRAHFIGDGTGTWVSFSSYQRDRHKIEISGFKVSNYVTAISINGSRKNINNWNGGHKIQNNLFFNIGQANAVGRPSTAAIRLVNSRHNEITDNEFHEIRNIKQCNLLHSIYLAHYSSFNEITRNVFDGGCGAVIKVRDASNANKITKNRFLNQSAEPFHDSFCDRSRSSLCTKKSAECPSWNNVLEANQVETKETKRGSGKRKLIVVKGQIQPDGCPAPVSGNARIKASGNIYIK